MAARESGCCACGCARGGLLLWRGKTDGCPRPMAERLAEPREAQHRHGEGKNPHGCVDKAADGDSRGRAPE